jgi:hypothetical protein
MVEILPKLLFLRYEGIHYPASNSSCCMQYHARDSFGCILILFASFARSLSYYYNHTHSSTIFIATVLAAFGRWFNSASIILCVVVNIILYIIYHLYVFKAFLFIILALRYNAADITIKTKGGTIKKHPSISV